jgi:uncharacterized protein with GYD domain
MPFYMIQADYSTEGSRRLAGHPQHREQALAKACESLGGRLVSFYYSFGDYDAVLIVELPDNQAAAALSMAADAGGATRTLKTTVLLTVAEAMDAMGRATAYAPPE